MAHAALVHPGRSCLHWLMALTAWTSHHSVWEGLFGIRPLVLTESAEPLFVGGARPGGLEGEDDCMRRRHIRPGSWRAWGC